MCQQNHRERWGELVGMRPCITNTEYYVLNVGSRGCFRVQNWQIGPFYILRYGVEGTTLVWSNQSLTIWQ